MSDIANKLITLSLNSAWKPIGFKTVKDAIIGLTGSEKKPDPTSLALDIEYELDDDGQPIFDNVINMRPVPWSEWITLPIRNWDLSISGANRSYRVPTVIVAVNYDKMQEKNSLEDQAKTVFCSEMTIPVRSLVRSFLEIF